MKMLMKEWKLCMHPTGYIMLLCAALVMVPGYPYGVTCFYMGLAIFFICLTARENLKRGGLSGKVLQTDALSFLSRGEKFDVIFVDPPYDSGLYAPVLQRINAVDNLTEGGIIVCEARVVTELPEMKGPYRKLWERKYGSVKICLYTRNADDGE